MRSVATPVARATASRSIARSRASIASQPLASRAIAATFARPLRTITAAIASSSAASVPGRIATCSSASRAVSERRGSTTTSLPPRWRSLRSRPRMSGAVIARAVRDDRIRADAEEVVAAIDVGHRHRERRPVEVIRRGEARAHVLRSRSVDVARAERLVETRAHQQRAVVVDDGIAPVDRDGVRAVALLHAAKAVGRFVERFVPRDRREDCRARCGATACARDPGRRAPRGSRCPSGTRSPSRSDRAGSGRTDRMRSPSTWKLSPQVASQSVQVRWTVVAISLLPERSDHAREAGRAERRLEGRRRAAPRRRAKPAFS